MSLYTHRPCGMQILTIYTVVKRGRGEMFWVLMVQRDVHVKLRGVKVSFLLRTDHYFTRLSTHS